MLHLAGRIALGVDVADLLEFQRAFQGDRKAGAAAEVKHVARLHHRAGDFGDALIVIENLVGATGHLGERLAELALFFPVDLAALRRERDHQAGEHRQLRGEGLGRGDADLRTGMRQDRRVRLPAHRAFLHVDDAGTC